MKYLAVKNKDGTGKAVCICNTSDELDDMASMFRDFEWEVFEEYEKNEALKWAGLNKISGFKLKENTLSGFEKTLILLREKGFSYAKVNLINKESLGIALDDLYCLSTNKLLKYDSLDKKFNIVTQTHFSYPKDLTEYIDEYQKCTKIKDREDAIEDYFDEYWRQFGRFPYQHIPKTEIIVNDNMIFIENAYNSITREFGEIYYLSRFEGSIVIPTTNILTITPQTLDYEISDSGILEVVKRI